MIGNDGEEYFNKVWVEKQNIDNSQLLFAGIVLFNKAMPDNNGLMF